MLIMTNVVYSRSSGSSIPSKFEDGDVLSRKNRFILNCLLIYPFCSRWVWFRVHLFHCFSQKFVLSLKHKLSNTNTNPGTNTFRKLTWTQPKTVYTDYSLLTRYGYYHLIKKTKSSICRTVIVQDRSKDQPDNHVHYRNNFSESP